jgi:hypothetical protein
MSNEAAERLRDLATDHESPWDEGAWQAALADHAAAAKDEGDKAGYAEGYRHGERFGRSQERRATVERIRAAWPEPDGERSTRILDAILDEEAAR